MYNTESRISRLYYTYQHETIIIQYHEQIAPITTVTTTGIELKGEIERTNQFEDEKQTNMKGKKRRTVLEPNHLIQEHQKKEMTEIYCLLCIAMPSRFLLYLCRVHEEATVTAAVVEREDEGVLVLLSFVQFQLDKTLFVAPDIQY